MRRPLLLVLLAAAVAATAAAASALGASGVRPLAPAAGAVVPVGQAPAFRARVRARGEVWVHVCRSPKRSRDGVICGRADLGRARRGPRGVATWTPRFHDFPGFWLNRPGVYFWQAYRIACRGGDCRQEGPVVRFRVG